MTGEFAFIERLRARFPRIGDDCAVVDGMLLATDMVVEGVDVPAGVAGDPGWARSLGRKAVTANVSDVAAMGGRPRYLLVAVAAPVGADLGALVDGVAEEAASYGCEVAGGDLSATAGPVVVAVAVTGEVPGGGEPVRRSGARPGDTVYVTGPLGAAAASGYRSWGRARVAEGEAARLAGATAMIDVSDGLAADLGHLATASGVGFALDEVPVAPGATLDQALHGGDDYELVFTGPPGLPGIRIGTVVADPAVRTLAGRPLPAGGWEHRW